MSGIKELPNLRFGHPGGLRHLLRGGLFQRDSAIIFKKPYIQNIRK
ncbi:MAG: hypothetical protein ACOX7B_10435 [Christensenellales bacterium]